MPERLPALLTHAEGRYADSTQQASSVARSLGITAVATVWLFAGGYAGPDPSPGTVLDSVQGDRGLALALALAVGALALDLLQYAWAAVAWGVLHWALDQMYANDSAPGPLTRRVRLGYFVARATWTVRHLEGDAAPVAGARPDPSWPARRAALRARLVGDAEVSAEDGGPWSPAFLNRTTATLFFAKIGCLVAAYAALALAVT